MDQDTSRALKYALVAGTGYLTYKAITAYGQQYRAQGFRDGIQLGSMGIQDPLPPDLAARNPQIPQPTGVDLEIVRARTASRATYQTNLQSSVRYGLAAGAALAATAYVLTR